MGQRHNGIQAYLRAISLCKMDLLVVLALPFYVLMLQILYKEVPPALIDGFFNSLKTGGFASILAAQLLGAGLGSAYYSFRSLVRIRVAFELEPSPAQARAQT